MSFLCRILMGIYATILWVSLLLNQIAWTMETACRFGLLVIVLPTIFVVFECVLGFAF